LTGVEAARGWIVKRPGKLLKMGLWDGIAGVLLKLLSYLFKLNHGRAGYP